MRKKTDYYFLNQQPERLIKSGDAGIGMQISYSSSLCRMQPPPPEAPFPPLCPAPNSSQAAHVLCLAHTRGSHFRLIALAVVSIWNRCSSPRQP